MDEPDQRHASPTAKGWGLTLSHCAGDFAWLLGIHIVILVVMTLMGGVDRGDIRVMAVFTVFLLPGWCLAPRLVSSRGSGLEVRYAVASVIAFALHVWIAWPGSRLGLSFDAYYAAMAIVLVASVTDRCRQIQHGQCLGYRLRPKQLVLFAGVLVLICGAYRIPHSNDINQFLMQQIDMAQQRNLSPSPIGMTAFGVDKPMPRWDANAYHVWFSLMGDVTRLPVEGIARRWATIPMACVSLLMLCLFVQRYVGRRVPMWIVVLAVLGPATLWFRTYSAYVYGMRVTNNFCLDKDFALFWLIPAWLWFFHAALRTGDKASWGMLMLMIGLCIAVHPMTSVYLCLLIPFAAVTAMKFNWCGLRRAVMGGGLAFGMFLFIYTSGGAQAYHEQIETLIQHDVRSSQQAGHPLHHWIGHYAAIPDAAESLDTTEWKEGKLRLRPSLLWTGSVLLSLFGASLVWAGVLLLQRNRTSEWRRVAGVAIALAMLFALFAVSSVFLTSRPHLYRGFERLHWFAFLPAGVAVAGCAAAIIRLSISFVSRSAIAWVATALLVCHLGEQGWHVSKGQQTLMSQVPWLHSVYDIYSPQQPGKDREVLDRFALLDGPVPERPDYLREDDRVLILMSIKRTAYWELRQAVWWPELYGEGFALAVHGEGFINDWQCYYGAVDWRSDVHVDQWIVDRKATILVDEREGADRYVQELGQRLGRTVKRVAPTAWRLGDPVSSKTN